MQQHGNSSVATEPARVHRQHQSFIGFVLNDPGNRKYLIVAGVAAIVQLIAFKLAYPFADYFMDAYTYIHAAANHSPVSYRQIGYSRFLSLFHAITVSDTAVVCFQYLFIELTAFYFFFSLLYFFRPAKKLMWVLFALLFFNPLHLYLSNYITSDALFVGASILWATGLLWIINRPRMAHIITHALVLVIAFNLRYAALFYPLITVLTFLVSPLKPTKKFAGIALSLLLMLGSAWYTIYKTWKFTGTATFSAFSGWQLANNALHIYPHVSNDTVSIEKAKYHKLETIVGQYFQENPGLSGGKATTQYMWDRRSPLKQYLKSYLRTHPNTEYFAAWNAAGPVFSNYGWALIKAHPVAFFKYYLLPNTGMYFVPDLESMHQYNEGLDTVDATAASWFGYNGPRITAASKNVQNTILAPFPFLLLAGNIFFIITCIWVFSAKTFRKEGPAFFATMLVLACFIVVNAAFSIFATANILRYSVFPLIMLYSFSTVVAGVFLSTGGRDEPLV